MLQVRGQRELASSVDIVRRRLLDTDFLVRCLPDVAQVEQLQEREAWLKVRPSFSFLTGKLTIHLRRVGEADQDGSEWWMEVRGIGYTAEARLTAKVQALTEQTTLLDYEVVVEQLGGLLRMVHSSLLQAAMEKAIHDFLERLEAELRRNSQPG